jgi:hypothetical protein
MIVELGRLFDGKHDWWIEMAKSKKLGPSWLDTAKIRIKMMLGMKVLLCDTCKWDWRSACHHPERPNATWCPDYEKRGR